MLAHVFELSETEALIRTHKDVPNLGISNHAYLLSRQVVFLAESRAQEYPAKASRKGLVRSQWIGKTTMTYHYHWHTCRVVAHLNPSSVLLPGTSATGVFLFRPGYGG